MRKSLTAMNVDELANLIQAAVKIHDMRLAELAAVEPKPVHGSTAPLVITFVKEFNGRNPYTYAAIRIPSTGMWSVTGKTSLNSVPWIAVAGFIRDEERNPDRAIESITRLVDDEIVKDSYRKIARLESKLRNETDECDCGSTSDDHHGHADYSLHGYGH